MSSSRKTINILGVTGSIGQAAADVIVANADQFTVNLLSAHQNEKGLKEAAERLGAKHAILTGRETINEALEEPVDITLCAISGMAGLDSMMQAIKYSKALAIANKEPLVAAGALVMQEAAKYQTKLLPVDSEHNAIFQVFDEAQRNTIERIVLTASGGPFREWSTQEMSVATKEQALAHPNWSMGDKISIDSATMMNKALEVIEAHFLFNMPADKIDVLIHPQSTVHSMVEYVDGSVLVQMGASDMRTPIANVLAWPQRLKTPGKKLDLTKMNNLTFEAPDTEKFPAISMAYESIKKGAHACIAFNASNEVAVDAFLDDKIGFADIIPCVRYALDHLEKEDLPTVNDIKRYDEVVRDMVEAYINNRTTQKIATV